MGSHRARHAYELVSIATGGGGRIHLTQDAIRTLCGAPLLDTATFHEGDWVEQMLSEVGNSTAICGRCRTRHNKTQRPLTPKSDD